MSFPSPPIIAMQKKSHQSVASLRREQRTNKQANTHPVLVEKLGLG